MRLILAVLAFAVMIPVAHADDEENTDGSSTPSGPICIQSTDGPTICLGTPPQ